MLAILGIYWVAHKIVIRHHAYLVVEKLYVVLQIVLIADEYFEADIVADARNTRDNLLIAFMVIKLMVTKDHFVHRTTSYILVAKVA
jgi:hypothetical protein